MIKTPLSTVIGGAFWTQGCTVIGGQQSFSQLIKKLFSNGEQGFFYDPNDLSTMYQDSAGSIPVTAAGQPVGLMLDKSAGLVIGSELVSAENSTFTAGTGDWVAFDSSISVVDGTLLVDASAVNGGTSLAMIGLKVGQAYVISCDARAGTSSAAQITLDYNGVVYTTEHDFTKITGVFFATRADASVKLISGTAGTFYIDNVSVKELSGNHAYQTVSASRPILRQNAVTGAYYLEFDGYDDFLVTNSINFTGTDKVSLLVGVRKLVDGSYGAIAELSSSSDTNPNGISFFSSSFQGFALQTGSPPDRTFGTVPMLASAPISICVAAQYDRAKSDVSEIKVRYNSGAYSSNGLSLEGASATGNFGNYPLYIGRRGGVSLPFNGHIYSLIGVGRLTTDAETAAIEKELAKRTGVTLSV